MTTPHRTKEVHEVPKAVAKVLAKMERENARLKEVLKDVHAVLSDIDLSDIKDSNDPVMLVVDKDKLIALMNSTIQAVSEGSKNE